MTFVSEHLLTMTATVQHRTSVAGSDVFGDPIMETVESEWPCWMAQTASHESTVNKVQSLEQWQLFLPAAAAGEVDTNDKVFVNGDEFEVDGPPWTVVNPRTGLTAFLFANLRRSR